MLLREIFKNLHTVMVILALFEQFSGSLFIFLVPIFECFIKYDAFCKHMQFRLCVLKATKVYCYEQGCKSMLSIGGDDLAKSTIF